MLSFDPLIQQYYEDVEEAWSRPSEAMSAVTLVSIAGGERDVMVPAHLSIMPTAINLAVSVSGHTHNHAHPNTFSSLDSSRSPELGIS